MPDIPNDETPAQPLFIGAADIAAMLGMSPSWVRGQRYKRRHGLPHILTVDAVMICSSPRYRREEILTWIDSLTSANDNCAEDSQGNDHA
jgi:hypothetical protein